MKFDLDGEDGNMGMELDQRIVFRNGGVMWDLKVKGCKIRKCGIERGSKWFVILCFFFKNIVFRFLKGQIYIVCLGVWLEFSVVC